MNLSFIHTTSGQLNLSNGVNRPASDLRASTANWVVVVVYMDRAQGPTVEVFCQNLRGTHTNPTNSLSESYGGRWPSEHVRLKGYLCGRAMGQDGRYGARPISSICCTDAVDDVLLPVHLSMTGECGPSAVAHRQPGTGCSLSLLWRPSIDLIGEQGMP